ncbi:unnamed protein product [Prunus armeniaca]
MVVMFRHVDNKRYVIERFMGIDALFARHHFLISRLCGPGYDGASNMNGEFNGLKTLIMKDSPCAFYVHCFAHQLQLALVSLAKDHSIIGAFITLVSNVLNIVGASSKRRDILREKQALKVIEAFSNGELSSRQGLNQELGVRRPCDTSHYVCT